MLNCEYNITCRQHKERIGQQNRRNGQHKERLLNYILTEQQRDQKSRIVKLVRWLVLWARSTTKDYIRTEHKLHSISKLFISQFIIPQVIFFFLAYLYSADTQHGNLPPAGWPILFCRPTQEPGVSHSQHRRNQERFWKKMQVNGPEG